MSVLVLQVDEVMRTLSNDGQYPFVVNDKTVDIVRFALNTGFTDVVLDGQTALRVMYQRPGETEVRAKTLVYYDTDGLHNYYDWQLAQSDLAKNGSLMVALCILDISGGEVSEWHTTPCAVRVLSTIHTDDSDEGDAEVTPTVKERVAVLETMIQRVASGAPIVVSSTSAMTDTEQIYVLSTDGNWYYHNGSAWVAGGEYGAVSTDTTLTQSGIPADAKAVGDKIGIIKSDVDAISAYNTTEIEFAPNLSIGRYIRISDGTSQSGGKYARTYALWYGKGYRTAIALEDNVYEFCLAFYGTNGDLVNGTDYIKSSGYVQGGTIVNIIPDAVKFGISFRRHDQAELTDSDLTAISAALKCYNSTAEIAKSAAQSALASCESITISKDIDKESGTIIDAYIGLAEGRIQRSSLTVKTIYFDCAPNTFYLIDHDYVGVFVVACYDAVPGFGSIATKFLNDRNASKTIFKTDASSQYLAVYYYSIKFNTETPETTLDSISIKTIGIDSIIAFMNEYSTYIPDKPNYNFYVSNDSVILADTFDDVIALYDELVESYPDYVTKEAFVSGSLTNYGYTFTLGNYNAKNGKRRQEPEIVKPKLLLLSGIHGYERSAVMSLYTVMKHMCENNYELADVIGYTTIKVLPVGNPWSYTNNSRVNANGVNINRNFDAPEWVSDGEGTNDYSGAEPADQDETQIIKDWIDANTDAILFIDFHNSSFVNEISCLISSNLANQSDYKCKYLLGINKIIPYFIKEKGIIGENIIYCYTGGSRSFNDNGRQVISYAYRQGIENAFVHESSWDVNNTGKHSKISIGTGAEVIGNMLIAFKPYYENIEIIPWTPE